MQKIPVTVDLIDFGGYCWQPIRLTYGTTSDLGGKDFGPRRERLLTLRDLEGKDVMDFGDEDLRSRWHSIRVMYGNYF